MQVETQLREVEARVGSIVGLLSDQGSDLVNGASLFSQSRALESSTEQNVGNGEAIVAKRKLLRLKDFSHASSHILKQHLHADPAWPEFLSHCGKTQPKIKQTPLGALAPPTQKVKGRYMNIGELIRWGVKMLNLQDETCGELPAGVDRAQLHAKFDWVRQFRQSLAVWSDIDQLRERSLDIIRRQGYSSKAIDEVIKCQLPYRNSLRSHQMGDDLIECIRSQCQDFFSGESFPGSSEIIESLMGKLKHMQGQHSRGGFTKMVLAVAGCVGELEDDETRKELLATTREQDVRQWVSDTIGRTLGSVRRLALRGTKTASKENC